MPLYEYQCASCGSVTEVIQSYSDELMTTCESCGGALKKLLSSPGFHFKGSGWYVSDYGRGGSGKRESSEGEGSDSKESKESKDSKDSKESKESKESKDAKDGSPAKGAGDSGSAKPAAPSSSGDSSPSGTGESKSG